MVSSVFTDDVIVIALVCDPLDYGSEFNDFRCPHAVTRHTVVEAQLLSVVIVLPMSSTSETGICTSVELEASCLALYLWRCPVFLSEFRGIPGMGSVVICSSRFSCFLPRNHAVRH